MECDRSTPDQLHDAPCQILVRRYSTETHRARDVVPATGTRGSRPPFVRIVALGTQPSQKLIDHSKESACGLGQRKQKSDGDLAHTAQSQTLRVALHAVRRQRDRARSEEHTSELQSLMRISYAVFCLTKKT